MKVWENGKITEKSLRRLQAKYKIKPNKNQREINDIK